MSTTASTEAQAGVDAYFDRETSFWSDIYSGADVYSVIHQYRLALALDWVDELRLAPGANVLEVGCGAGLTAVALAHRGFEVVATDAAPAMIEMARANVDRAGLGPRIQTRRADVQALDFPDETFDLVVALGVVPWVASPEAALREIGRVIAPGGSFIGNADNSARLSRLADPRTNPRLGDLRVRLKRLLARLGARFPEMPPVVSTHHAIAEFDQLLVAAGLRLSNGRTFGFGPFTMFNREVVRGRPAVALHRGLQVLADRGLPGLRYTGSQYIVLARKPAERASAPR